MIADSIKIFYSYAPQDQELQRELEAHLGALKRLGYLTTWSDRDVSPGVIYHDELKRSLQEANIILLLISADFLSSNACYSEMTLALEQYERGDASVIPIILRHCHWEKTPLAQLEVLPMNHVPVTKFQDPDEAFCDIAKELRYMVENLLVNKWKDEGDELYKSRQYNEALNSYEKILHLKNSLAATVCAGNVLNDLTQYEEVLYLYEDPLEITKRTETPFHGSVPENHSEIQETQLVEEVRQGDPDALRRLYETYVDVIYRYVSRRIGNKDDAEDVTSEIFTRAVKLLITGRYIPQGKPFGAWLMGIARHIYQEWRQDRNKELGIVPFEDLNRRLYEEALQIYEQVFQQSPSNNPRSLWPGLTRDALPMVAAEASWSIISRLNQAIQRNPMNPFLYHLKGNVFFQLSDYLKALGAYEQAVQLQAGFELSQQYLSETIEHISQQEYKKFNDLARRDLEKANQIRDRKSPFH